jgi:hypothetical protein
LLPNWVFPTPMKEFTDDEYVGYGKLVYDEPLCTWLAEHDLRLRGYKRVVIPHIRTVGETEKQKGVPVLSDWKAVVANNVELMINSIRELPLFLYAVWNFDGGTKLVPFIVRQGTFVKTHLRDAANKPVYVDVVEEEHIKLI